MTKTRDARTLLWISLAVAGVLVLYAIAFTRSDAGPRRHGAQPGIADRDVPSGQGALDAPASAPLERAAAGAAGSGSPSLGSAGGAPAEVEPEPPVVDVRPAVQPEPPPPVDILPPTRDEPVEAPRKPARDTGLVFTNRPEDGKR